jgi:prepilin-type processing-associated H-X9-DG protein
MAILVTCGCGRKFEAGEASAGSSVWCPDCGRELMVPKPAMGSELLSVSWEPAQSRYSGKAIASFLVGTCFFFVCLTGAPAIEFGRQALRDIAMSKGRLRGRRLAIAGIVFGVIGCLFTIALFMPAVRSAREAARRTQCTNNLKQIGLALHTYHENEGRLPAAAITDKNGRPLLSWRVAILPYLEASSLYSKFRLDEPWDSPHNLALLEPMPLVYACPSDKERKPGMSDYLCVVGPETVFPPNLKPVQVRDITDGVHATIVVSESLRNVPWTKPEDLPLDMAVMQSGLGSQHGYHINGLNALFADGSVRFLKRSINPNVLRALLTRNGNETVSEELY